MNIQTLFGFNKNNHKNFEQDLLSSQILFSKVQPQQILSVKKITRLNKKVNSLFSFNRQNALTTLQSKT